jgi:hypothetical protein
MPGTLPAAVPLLIFAGVNFCVCQHAAMPATWYTYRFLVFLGLPCPFHRDDVVGMAVLRQAVEVAIAALVIGREPSSGDRHVLQRFVVRAATPADVKALGG